MSDPVKSGQVTLDQVSSSQFKLVQVSSSQFKLVQVSSSLNEERLGQARLKLFSV